MILIRRKYAYLLLLIISMSCQSRLDLETSRVIRMDIKGISTGILYPVNAGNRIMKRAEFETVVERELIDSMIKHLIALEEDSVRFQKSTIYGRAILYNDQREQIKVDYNKYQVKIGSVAYRATEEFEDFFYSLFEEEIKFR